MSGTLRLPRVLLGPRDQGRNFGLIAASPGLALSREALSRASDFNLRVGEYLNEGERIDALFPLEGDGDGGEALWLLSTSVQRGATHGNPVWITAGVVFGATEAERMAGRAHRLLGAPLLDFGDRLADLPPLETALPLARTAPRGAGAAAGDAHALASRLTAGEAVAAEIAAAMGEGATLEAILDQTPPAVREQLSFVTAPVMAVRPRLVVYARETWPRARAVVERTHRIVALGLGAPPAEPSEAVRAWAALARAVGDGADGAAARRLEQRLWLAAEREGRAGADTPPDDASARDLIRRRVGAVLAAEPDEGLRIAWLGRLLRTTAALPADPARQATALALYDVFEDQVKASARPGAWFDSYYGGGLEAALGELRPPPAFMPRLALETRALFALSPAVAEVLAPVLTNLLGAGLIELARGARRAPAIDRLLLAEALPGLARGGRAAELCAVFGGRVLAGAAAATSADRAEGRALLVALWREMAANLDPGVLRQLARHDGADLAEVVGSAEVSRWFDTAAPEAARACRPGGRWNGAGLRFGLALWSARRRFEERFA